MKLTYRGNAYESPTLIQPDFAATDRSSIKLTYRGHTYYTTSCPLMVSKAIKPDRQTIALIYRGNTYERKFQSLQSDQNFPVIN